MICKKCGKEIEEGTKFCPHCGESQDSNANSVQSSVVSPKSRTIAAVLAFFLGGLGVHRFYVGKIGSGVAQILLTCCFGIGYVWALIDMIVILCGNFRDSENKLIVNWDAKY